MRIMLVPQLKMASSPVIDDRPDSIDERMKIYEEWIYTAEVRHIRTFSMMVTEASTRRAEP